MKFNTFIHDVRILKALDALGFHDLTSVQQNTIPVLLDNKDCIVQSKTGSGKTAAYALPILEKIIIDQKEPFWRQLENLCYKFKKHLIIWVCIRKSKQ